MADLYLPETPLPKSASPAAIVFGGWQGGATGGEETWIGFMGNRMSMTLTTPNLRPEPDGRLWTAALLDAYFGGLIVGCRFFQPGFTTGVSGNPVVHGGGQSGTILGMVGATAGSVMRRREFFSIVTGGRRTIHYVRQDTVFDADGRSDVLIYPPLHVQPNNGDTIEFGTPMIEGKLTGEAKGWTNVIARTQGLTFTITETR